MPTEETDLSEPSADTPDDPATVPPSTTVPRFAALSRSYAERGEGRLAVLAMWGADLEVLQQLLWESGLAEAPDPLAQVAAVGEAVLGSLEAAPAPGADSTARQTVEAARAAMVATFDESVHAMLEERLLPLDHLDGLAAPEADDANRSAARRLSGRTAHELAADLKTTAADCMAVAEVMLLEDDLAGALRQVRQADLASFEAYLVMAAVRAGDAALASVDLRWELAAVLGLGTQAEEEDFTATVTRWRERLVEFVEPAEADSLRSCFEPVPGQ